ncbi:hypothetical protein HYFRA_00009004 [Hymenoscyphus fraxineus]|uniref:Uncharacterized protein n=1 Tax=Hymenoscyphus fraxineus TaxID=746836 RepID=A0A9N9PR50_9HELO|nr:hypothetical protein HYFRA_00009004 [Hymenoscyphus fraxineus]
MLDCIKPSARDEEVLVASKPLAYTMVMLPWRILKCQDLIVSKTSFIYIIIIRIKKLDRSSKQFNELRSILDVASNKTVLVFALILDVPFNTTIVIIIIIEMPSTPNIEFPEGGASLTSTTPTPPTSITTPTSTTPTPPPATPPTSTTNDCEVTQNYVEDDGPEDYPDPVDHPEYYAYFPLSPPFAPQISL